MKRWKVHQVSPALPYSNLGLFSLHLLHSSAHAHAHLAFWLTIYSHTRYPTNFCSFAKSRLTRLTNPHAWPYPERARHSCQASRLLSSSNALLAWEACAVLWEGNARNIQWAKGVLLRSANSPLGFVSHACVHCASLWFLSQSLVQSAEKGVVPAPKKVQSADWWMDETSSQGQQFVLSRNSRSMLQKMSLIGKPKGINSPRQCPGSSFQIIECQSCHQVFGCRAVNPAEREQDPLDSIKSVQKQWIGLNWCGRPGNAYSSIDTLKRDPRKHLRCSRRTLQCLVAIARQKFPQTLQWQPAKHCHTSHPMSQRYSLWQLWFQPRLRSNDCCYSNAQKQYVFRVSA